MTVTDTNPTTHATSEEAVSTDTPKRAPIVWEKPGMGKKLAFTLPAFSTSAMIAPLSIELKIFYTDVMLVPPGLLALVTALARAFDALVDPVMAYITDNIRTRWGRRKVFLPIGVPLSAFCYWMMFSPPRSLTEPISIAIWAGLSFGFYYVFAAVWAVPYHALGLELSPDFHDRTQIFAIRSICGGVGTILSFLSLTWLHGQVGGDRWFIDTRQMLHILTGLLALQMFFFYLLPVIGVKEHPEFSRRKGAPLVPGVRRALRNRPFKIILSTMVIGSIASSIPPLLMPFFSKYILHLPDRWRTIFALVYVAAGFVSIPFWMYMSRRLGKLSLIVMASITAGTCGFIFWFVRQGMILAMGVLEFIRGFCTGAQQIVSPSMLADIIDYDEFRTGKRREAQFGMFLSLLPKFISIVAATLPLVILGASGYDPSKGVMALPDSAVLAIRCLFSWFPLGFQAIVLMIILKYPINQAVHQKIREGVIFHQQGKEAVDPITGRTVPAHDMGAVPEDTGWFLDYFSPKELKTIMGQGTKGLLTRVKIPVVRYAMVCFGAVIFTIWLLHDSMSMSQADQIKQGVGTLFIIIAGISLTLTVFHILRIRAAKKMIAQPINANVIQEHLKAI
jgi:GPH family glycoside/pentoside/hexuronide:cation symporter